ncbi:MAG: cytochrome c biogenesis protein ResB [Chloroflexi bacterium]|nr:cytochrome c biogenesis protein ResB [Chloroflexota bacterium]
MVAIAISKNGKRGARPMAARLVSRILAVLASHNIALALMGLLLFSLAVQAALPQRGVATDLQYTMWRARYPFIARLAETTGLDRVASMPWFWAISVVLALALSVSVSRRAWRLARRGASPRGPRAEVSLAASSDVPANVESMLRSKRYAVATQGLGIAARTGAIGPWGSLLFHAGLLVLIAGAFLSAATRFVGYVELAPGQVFQERNGYAQQRSGPLASSQPMLTAYVEDLSLTFWPDGSVKSISANAALNSGSGGEDAGDIGRNGSLRVGATTLTLGSPLGPAALLRYTPNSDSQPAEGYLNFFEVSGRLVNRFNVPGTDASFQAEMSGDWRSALEGKPGASVWLEMRPERSAPGAARERVDMGAKMPLAGGTLEFAGVRPWALFMVSRDVGYPVLLAGALLAILGLTLALFVSPRWVFLSCNGDGWRLSLQGPGPRDRLERDLRALAASVSPPVRQ